MFKDADIFIYFGVGHASLINKLINNKIKVLRAISKDNKLIIYANTKDRQKIIALFDELCYNYKLSKSVGLMRTFKKIISRKGLAVSIILALIFFSIVPQFVLDIRIKSDMVSKDEVERIIDENGIHVWQLKQKVDTKALEFAIQSIDGVAFATVEKVGSTLIVTLHEELPRANIIDVINIKPIVSVSDAVISRQLIYSGTANFKKGDIVRAGETLIEPYVLVGEEEEVKVSARGEVYGIISYTSNIMYRENRIERIRSGKSCSYTKINFIGLESKEKLPPYKMYESVTKSYKGGYIFPLSTVTTTYYELKDTEIYEPIAEAEGRLTNRVNEMVLEKIPASSRIIKKYANVKQMGDYYLVEAVVQVEQRIDKNADI